MILEGKVSEFDLDFNFLIIFYLDSPTLFSYTFKRELEVERSKKTPKPRRIVHEDLNLRIFGL